jgi:hypothetical protein
MAHYVYYDKQGYAKDVTKSLGQLEPHELAFCYRVLLYEKGDCYNYIAMFEEDPTEYIATHNFEIAKCEKSFDA